MQRSILLLGALTVLLGVGGSASAGYWEVEYDLAGSTAQTIVTAAGTTDVDDVTGSFTIQYDTPGAATAPITGARLVAGTTHLSMFQTNGGVFTLTGSTDTVLSPPLPNGIPGTIAGATLSGLSGITNSVTGFIHCYDGPILCSQVNFTNSVQVPQTSLGPLDLGNLVFTGTGTAPVGNSDFTSTGVTVLVPPPPPPAPQFTVSLLTTYVGKEISRTFVPEPSGWLQLAAGVAGLLVLARRRGRMSVARVGASADQTSKPV